MSTVMRAKMAISHVAVGSGCETWHFYAVCKSDGYPADGSDENNTFANWTPSASLQMTVTNPELLGRFRLGDTFYVDFTPAPK
jgi:hypothetical protein